MRKFLLHILSIIVPAIAFAEMDVYNYGTYILVPYDFESEGIYYSINQDSSVSVTIGLKDADCKTFDSQTYEFYTGDVVIPEFVEHEGVTYSVTAIQNHAFTNNEKLESVELPESVTSIGRGAFARCTHLKNVALPTGLKEIGEFAFYQCESLEEMTIPDGVEEIYPGAFRGCKNYKGFRFPRKLRSLYPIDADMSYYADNLVLPDSLSYVYDVPPTRRLEFGKNIPRGPYYLCPLIKGNNSTLYLPDDLEEFVLPKSKFGVHSDVKAGKNLKRVILPAIDSINVGRLGTCGFFPSRQYEPFKLISMSATPPVMIDKVNFNYFSNTWDWCPPENEFWSVDNCWGSYNVELIVPAGSEEAYRNAPIWCEFKNIRGDADIQRFLPGDIDAIKTIEVSPQTPPRIYNIRGIYMGSSTEGLAPGLYIIHCGDSVSKIKI